MSSADTMHDDVMREHPGLLQCVESDVKQMFLESCRMKISPVCRAIQTTSSASVALHEMFPVTQGARMFDVRKEAGFKLPEWIPGAIPLFSVLETKHHGLVMLLAVGYTVTKSEFKIAPFEQLRLTDDLCLSVSSKQATFSSKNKQRKAAAAVSEPEGTLPVHPRGDNPDAGHQRGGAAADRDQAPPLLPLLGQAPVSGLVLLPRLPDRALSRAQAAVREDAEAMKAPCKICQVKSATILIRCLKYKRVRHPMKTRTNGSANPRKQESGS